MSAFTFALVGPTLQIITAPKGAHTIDFNSVLSPKLSQILESLWGKLEFPAEMIWNNLPIIIVITALCRAGLALLQWYLWERTSELIARDMRSDLISSYLQLGADARRDNAEEIDKEISAGIGTDVRMVREYLVHFFGGFPRELVQVIFYIAALFVLDWQLASFFLLGIGPAGVLVSRLGKKLRKRSQKALDSSSLLVEWLQQRFTGIETIKHYATEDLEKTNIETKARELNKLYVRVARVKARTAPLMEFLATVVMILVLYYALRHIADGTLKSSTLLSFFAVLGILSQSASKLGRYYNSNKEGEAALHRLQKMKDLMQSSDHHLIEMFLNKKQNKILDIEDISYRYPNSKVEALSRIDWRLEKGKIYALAGSSGSGKSTLLKLILGLWKIQTGQIKIYLNHLSELVYLPQNYRLFPGSIAQNVAYPHEDIDADRVWLALEKVGLKTFVQGQAFGLETRVGEGGLGLSGGQSQRIGLARVLYLASEFIVIDEGTSALDPEMEALTLNSLRELVITHDSTILMVAHRLTTLQASDEVLVLSQGLQMYKGLTSTFFESDEWKKLFDRS